MIKKLISKKNRVLPILLALMIIGSVSVIGVMGKSKAPAVNHTVTSENAPDNSIYSQIFNHSLNRCRWLYDLLNLTGKAELTNSSDAVAIFDTAQSCGIISGYSKDEMFLPLDRLFVAQTTVKAMDYKNRSVGMIADINMLQSDLSTMAYYGYFLPDINDMIYPEREITEDEYDALIGELNRCRQLKGKKILTFGDSIMHGSGSQNMGIGQTVAEKYGMIYADYSVPGASVGIRENRGHIRDQLQKAVNDGFQPDIILINGGTNDMNHTALGSVISGFDAAGIKEDDFSGGLEKTLWNLQQNWKDVPVIYIRVHNMDLGPDEKERLYGERALEIARKWKVVSVDLYSNTAMNTEDTPTCNKYTYRDDNSNYTFDSIHPNALGYAKFYLPQITQEIMNQIGEE